MNKYLASVVSFSCENFNLTVNDCRFTKSLHMSRISQKDKGVIMRNLFDTNFIQDFHICISLPLKRIGVTGIEMASFGQTFRILSIIEGAIFFKNRALSKGLEAISIRKKI